MFWVDSVLTFLIALYLVWMGYDLLKNSTKVLMLFTPDSIPIQKIVDEINAFESIKNVHHVHVWQLNEEEIHLEAHIDFNNDITLSAFDVILHEIEDLVFKKYDINHVNIQPEYGKDDAKEVIVQD
jgi:cobalt-zinc-cadmium efflux system protein